VVAGLWEVAATAVTPLHYSGGQFHADSRHTGPAARATGASPATTGNWTRGSEGARTADAPLSSPDGTWEETEDGWIATAVEIGPRVLQWVSPIDLTSASAARLCFESFLTTLDSRALIQVSLDGGLTWMTTYVAAPTDTWQPIEVHFDQFLGEQVEVRLLFEAITPTTGEQADIWRVRALTVVSEDESTGSHRP